MTATANSNEAVHVLDRLLILCTDGREGYRRAAAAIDEPNVHHVLFNGAVVRDEILSVLTNAVVSLGEHPAHHGSISGAIHRRWLDAIAALKPHATLAILHECMRGEQETLAGFTSALGQGLPEHIHAVVQSQRGRVLEASSALQRVIAEVEEKERSHPSTVSL